MQAVPANHMHQITLFVHVFELKEL